MIVHEGIEPKLIQLTPITGMLDPAKWQFWGGDPSAIDGGHASFDLFSDGFGMFRIA